MSSDASSGNHTTLLLVHMSREDRITHTLCHPREEKETERKNERKKEELTVLSHFWGTSRQAVVRGEGFGQER